jgi:hypothetical protein
MSVKLQTEIKWIRKPKKVWSFTKDWEKFQGEHVAFAAPGSDVIIAHGKDARDVLAEAKKYVEQPSLMLIPQGGFASFLCLNSLAE